MCMLKRIKKFTPIMKYLKYQANIFIYFIFVIHVKQSQNSNVTKII